MIERVGKRSTIVAIKCVEVYVYAPCNLTTKYTCNPSALVLSFVNRL